MTRVLKLTVLATLFGQVALAQTPAPSTPAPVDPAAQTAPAAPVAAAAGVAPTADAPAAAGDTTISAPQQANISTQEMLSQSQDYRARMNDTLGRINGLIEAARKDKDIIRLNCLTDKVVQVKADMSIADQATSSLQESGARGDSGAAQHEFTRITIVNQKVQVLSSEADACVGEDLTFVGQTKVDVTYSGPPVPDSVTQPPAPTLTVDRPGVVSAYR